MELLPTLPKLLDNNERLQFSVSKYTTLSNFQHMLEDFHGSEMLGSFEMPTDAPQP